MQSNRSWNSVPLPRKSLSCFSMLFKFSANPKSSRNLVLDSFETSSSPEFGNGSTLDPTTHFLISCGFCWMTSQSRLFPTLKRVSKLLVFFNLHEPNNNG
uniref:Uncharacterized protein n=1 Tax=Rhizophora mucronata TaxID=61149 RepID=A0A2P2IYN1_RHIMU